MGKWAPTHVVLNAGSDEDTKQREKLGRYYRDMPVLGSRINGTSPGANGSEM